MVLMALFFSCLVSIFFSEDDLKKKKYMTRLPHLFFSHCLTFFFLSLSLSIFGEMHLARTHSCLHFTCVLCLCTLSCVLGFQRFIEQLKILEAKKEKTNRGRYYAKKKRDAGSLLRDGLTNAVKKGLESPRKKKDKEHS